MAEAAGGWGAGGGREGRKWKEPDKRGCLRGGATQRGWPPWSPLPTQGCTQYAAQLPEGRWTGGCLLSALTPAVFKARQAAVSRYQESKTVADGRQAGTCLPAGLVVSLWGCQATKRPGLLGCLRPAGQLAQ